MVPVNSRFPTTDPIFSRTWNKLTAFMTNSKRITQQTIQKNQNSFVLMDIGRDRINTAS